MMFLLWLVIAVIAVALLAYAYWVFLLAEYNEPVNVEEIHPVQTQDLWTLRLYRKRPAGDGNGEPVLMVHAAAANRLNYLVPEGLSIADYLAALGYDCWAIDLRGDRSSQPPYGKSRNEPCFEDYVEKDLPAAIEYICKTTGYDKVHWLGQSMGGMLLYAYEQVVGGDAIASGVTVAAPIGFAGSRHTRRPACVAVVRYARPVLSAVIRGLSPVFSIIGKGPIRPPVNWDNVRPECNGRLFFHGVEIPPYRVLDQMDTWASTKSWKLKDGTDLAAGLNTIKTPLLAFFAARDPFVDMEAAEAFFNALPSDDKQMKILSKEHGCGADYGHIDPLFSRHSEEDVFAPTAEWLAAHSIATAKTKAAPKKKAAAKTKAAPEEQAAAADSKAAPKKKAASKSKSAPKKKAAAKSEAAPKKKAASKSKAAPKKKAAAKSEAAPKKKAASKSKATPKKKAASKNKATPKKKAAASDTTGSTESNAPSTPTEGEGNASQE